MTNSRAAPKGLAILVKQADQTKNSDDSLAADSELVLPVAASKQYYFEITIHVSSGTTPDFKYDITGPSGAVGDRINGAHHSTTPTAVSSMGTLVTLTSTGVAETILITGEILTSTTAGNISFRWAQATSNAGATTVYAGSTLKLFEST